MEKKSGTSFVLKLQRALCRIIEFIPVDKSYLADFMPFLTENVSCALPNIDFLAYATWNRKNNKINCKIKNNRLCSYKTILSIRITALI